MKTSSSILRLYIEIGAVIVLAAGAGFLSHTILKEHPAWHRKALDAAVGAASLSLIVWRLRVDHEASISSHGDAKSDSRLQSRIPLAAALGVFLVGTLMSALGAWELNRQESSVQAERFGRMADWVRSEVQRRVNCFSYGLRGARGPFIVNESVSRSAFRSYVASRDLSREFQGARGFGYVQRVRREDLPAFLSETRRDVPDFEVRSSGDNPYLYIIKYIEPLGKNRPALGLDFASDPPRRDALEQSMLSGEATITSKVKVLLDEDNRSGCVCYLPVYRPGAIPETPEARRQELQGWVYAPVVISEALEGAFDVLKNQVHIDIYDGPAAVADQQVYDSNLSRQGESRETNETSRMFQQQSTVIVNGRIWLVCLETTRDFEANAESAAPVLLAGGGILLSLLLAIVVWTFGSGRARALALARTMTAELRLSEAQARDAAERLAQSERDYRRLFEQAHDAIIIFAPDDEVVVEVNDRACQMYGFSREEFIGMSLREISENTARGSEQIADTLRNGSKLNLESFQYRKDGSIMPVEINASVIEYGGRRVVLSINRDVTWRKQAEAQLVKAAQRDALATIAEGITHEFNSMLMTANIFLRVPASADESQEPSIDKVSKIIQQAQSMSASLLELFAGSEHNHVPTLRLDTWLPERIGYLSGLLPARVRIQFSPPIPTLPVMVRAEPLALEQVLRIILTNASEALPDGGDIHVSVRTLPDEISSSPVAEIRIADQGHGVPEADRGRLFEPFFTSRRRSRRSGLGLAIATRLVEQLRGTLTFEPNQPQGSVFVIRLLMAQGESHELETGNRG